jgi:hypothetical protein
MQKAARDRAAFTAWVFLEAPDRRFGFFARSGAAAGDVADPADQLSPRAAHQAAWPPYSVILDTTCRARLGITLS